MYQKKMSLNSIAKMYSKNNYQALYQNIVQAKKFNTSSCSKSCKIFKKQLNFNFKKKAA